MSKKILHITNFASREVTDGGTNREEALASFFAKKGAKRLIVCDEKFSRSKPARLTRIIRLMSEIASVRPDVVVLNYPQYPFFWSHSLSLYYLYSLFFAKKLRKYADKNKAKVLVDVMDFPLFQHKDLGTESKLDESDFRKFDSTVLHAADKVWICSHELTGLAQKEYNLPDQKLETVVNGSVHFELDTVAREDGKTRFVSCGGLTKERGTKDMIDAFCAAQMDDAEMHLAGMGGEWIAEDYKDENIVYHGALSASDAAKLAAGCDVGVIYYPQKGYYQLAFATKLPFYLACGIPVLATNVRETGGAVARLGVGRIAEESEFASVMKDWAGAPDVKGPYAYNIEKAASELEWDRLFSSAYAGLLGEGN